MPWMRLRSRHVLHATPFRQPFRRQRGWFFATRATTSLETLFSLSLRDDRRILIEHWPTSSSPSGLTRRSRGTGSIWGERGQRDGSGFDAGVTKGGFRSSVLSCTVFVQSSSEMFLRSTVVAPTDRRGTLINPQIRNFQPRLYIQS